MSDSYHITSPFIGQKFDHPLTKKEFEALKSAKSLIFEYIGFEEGVLQLLYATEEFEAFLLTTGLDHYLFPLREHDRIQNTRLRANLKVGAFLNSVTSLRDQFPKFKSLLPGVNLREQFLDLWQKQKAKSVAFAFCERFRNYAQHQTQPVYSVTSGGAWDQGRVLMENRVSLFANVDDVCANRSIDAAERSQYRAAFGANCDISLIFRETVGEIGEIVKAIRLSSEPEFAAQMKIYEEFLAVVRSYVGGDRVVADVSRRVGGVPAEKFAIFSDFSERAIRLRRTYVMTNNESHFVSGKARGHQ